MRVLLVDDDEKLANGILHSHMSESNTIDWVQNGEDALLTLSLESFDAIILDIVLPDVDGWSVLKTLRSKGDNTPVLILSSLSETQYRVLGLTLGADDYVPKPFDPLELEARINAISRRLSGRVGLVLTYREIELEPTGRHVSFQGKDVRLNKYEFSLLRELIEKRGRILSKEDLEQTIYGWKKYVESNTIEVYISNLRKKFYKKLIRTVRGTGYIIDN